MAEGVSGVDGDLKVVQRQLEALAGLTREYAGLLGKVEGYQQTIATNRQNLEDAVPQDSPEGDRGIFRHPLEQTRLWQRQIETDLIYYRVEQRQAMVSLQALQTQVEIRRAEIDRQTNRWLFLIGAVLAVGQLVDQDTADTLSTWFNVPVGVTLVRITLTAIALILLAIWLHLSSQTTDHRRSP